MLEVRGAGEIYEKEGGWFNARWHFSFDEYRDPEYEQIGPPRVFNDDRLEPGVEQRVFTTEGRTNTRLNAIGADGRRDLRLNRLARGILG